MHTTNNAPVILYADDDALLREIFDFILKESGFTLRTASNGAEAMRLLSDRQFVPDLILLDLEMPALNGLEVARQIKAGPPPTRDVPIVLLSTHGATHPDIQAAFEAGIAGYISKLHLRLEQLPVLIQGFLPAQAWSNNDDEFFLRFSEKLTRRITQKQVEQRTIRLIQEFQAHLTEVAALTAAQPDQRVVFEAWVVQKIAGLQVGLEYVAQTQQQIAAADDTLKLNDQQ